MTTRTPSTKAETRPDGSPVAVCDEPSVPVSSGVGVGVGSVPAESPGPAHADSETAHTSSTAGSIFRISNSPSVDERAEIARCLSLYSIPYPLPQSYPAVPDEAEGLEADRTLFVRLYREGRLDEARALCVDRLGSLALDDSTRRVAWTCNLTMVLRDGGDNAYSIALLNLVSPFAERAHPLTRARFHNGWGRTYELDKQPEKAVREYAKAAPLFVEGGHAWEVSKPVFSIGRVLASLGRTEEARAHLLVSARVALSFGDFLTLGEIGVEGAKL